MSCKIKYLQPILSLILVLTVVFSFAQNATDYYIVKFHNQISQEHTSTIRQHNPLIEIEDLDNSLTEKGFMLINTQATENKSHFINILTASTDVAFISPVYFVSDKKIITYTNEIFISYKTSPSQSALHLLESRFGIIHAPTFSGVGNIYKYILPKDVGTDIHALCREIMQHAGVRYCQPNYMFTPEVLTNDPFFPRQWALQNMGTPLQYNGTAGADMKVVDAWEITRGNPNIRIAILDSGVDTLHPDLAANLLSGFDALGQGSNGYPSKNFSSDAHGTACAGIVAAVADNGIGIAGVAPLCKIVPVRVFHYINFMGQVIPWSTSEWMVNGITWAWQEGKADVLSNSWGITDQFLSMFPGQDSVVNEAIFLALSNGRNGKGIPMLFSSGNDGDPPIWPSRLPEVIAVNASSMCDERKNPSSCDNESFWEGNWGEGLDITAPGVKIYTTDITGPFGYSTGAYTHNFNGTSSACPNAAGVMALILSVNPHLSVQQARYVIESTCDKVGGYDYNLQKASGTWSQEMGYGRVNAHSAVLKALELIPPDIASDFFVYHYTDNGKHIIACNLENSSVVYLEIFNLYGVRLAEYPEQLLEKGLNLFYLNKDLNQGIYLARLSVNGVSRVVKFFTYR